MNAFARRVRALAVRFCGRTTMERIVDPILADIELEHREALDAGRAWAARWSLARGYVALCKAVVLHGMHVGAQSWLTDEATKRTIGFSLAAFVLVTVALVLPPLVNTPKALSGLDIYLVPQAIPLSIPIALSFGIALGWSSHATARAMLRRVLVPALAGMLLALASMEWLVPAANEAWRVAVVRRLAKKDPSIRPNLPRGIGERSLSELAALVRQSSTARTLPGENYTFRAIRELSAGEPKSSAKRLQLAFHSRLAVCVASALLALLAVTTAGAIRGRNLARGVFAAIVLLYIAAWFGTSATARTLPPAAVAWLPNAALAAVSLLLLGARSIRSHTSPLNE